MNIRTWERSRLIADRLRQLREDHGLSLNTLTQVIQRETDIPISRSALLNYEINEPDHPRLRTGYIPNLGMKAEFIIAFSRFYDVSTDYILGESDDPRPNTSMGILSRASGLSREAVEVLVSLSQKDKEALEHLLVSGTLPQVLGEARKGSGEKG